MGVFDFVRDAGAKVGIGKSTAERKEDAAAEAAAESARDAGKQAAIDANAQIAAKAAADRKNEETASKAREKLAERKKAARVERFAEYKKSNELEKYVADMGINMDGIDIRYDDGVAYIEGEAADQSTKERIILSVGNASGVAKVDEEMTVAPAAPPEPPMVFHKVEAGDTLWAVAERVYGDGNRYNEIFEANKPMLSDPDLIFPGQVLRCPK